MNDWLGRIAYYIRSKDGVSWKTEEGEAYMPGIAKHADGTVEDWHKFERMRVFQDNYGRAIQANFAVIDVEKNLDRPNDKHSSKNISVPLMPGRLLTLLDQKKITTSTRTIRLKISAEKDFNPQTDIDLKAVHFGGSGAVNKGKGAGVLQTEKSGKDLIIIFDATGCEIPEDDYVAKLIGKTKQGKLLYGYARLPWVRFNDPILSARLPEVIVKSGVTIFRTEVQNFGQFASKNATMQISYMNKGISTVIASGKVSGLMPFKKTVVNLSSNTAFDKGLPYDFTITILQEHIRPVALRAKLTPAPVK